MDFAGINYLAILVAAVASFGLGAAWYTALAKPWMAAVGWSAEKIARHKEQGPESKAPFIIAFAAELVMAWVLAGVIGHLGTGQVTVSNGVISGFFVWFGFVATTMAVNHAYGGQKRMLSLIDGGHWLAVLLLQGAIIGAFGV